MVDLPALTAVRQAVGRATPLERVMYFVYVLKSEKDGNIYIGITNDLHRRISQHNRGANLSTKHRRPLRIVYEERVKDRAEARRRKKYLKSGIGRKWLKSNIVNRP